MNKQQQNIVVSFVKGEVKIGKLAKQLLQAHQDDHALLISELNSPEKFLTAHVDNAAIERFFKNSWIKTVKNNAVSFGLLFTTAKNRFVAVSVKPNNDDKPNDDDKPNNDDKPDLDLLVQFEIAAENAYLGGWTIAQLIDTMQNSLSDVNVKRA